MIVEVFFENVSSDTVYLRMNTPKFVAGLISYVIEIKVWFE